MDGDISFPISPDSSAVDLLCTLQPPSSQLDFTWSSGDIPLVLYDDAYAEEHPVSVFEGGNRGSIATLGTKAGKRHPPSPQRISIGSRAGRDYDLDSSGSSETICSAGTFGARPRFSNAVEMPESSPITEGMPQSQLQKSPVVSKGSEKEENVLSGVLFSHGAIQQATQNNSDMFLTHREWQRLNTEDWYFAPSHTSICESDFVEPPSSATNTPLIFERSADGVLSPETPKKKAVSQVSASVHEWDYKRNKGIVAQEDSAQFSTQSQVGFDEPVHRLASRSLSNAFENRRPGLKLVNVSPPHALGDIQDPQTPSPKGRISLSPSSSPYQEDFPWLKDITVQFLIDQEGFRDAEPCFKYSGILRVRSASQTKKPEKLMAQFRPVSRQHFHFHHAPLESPPVLRRITVNSDESSDYVSKQAHLTLKLNGVFVVQGHEMSSAEDNSESSKLCWQFEYLVDNRRVDISGSSRDLAGEKTLTPLTFSCSPELLLPSQAKRINIMHVFKKSIAPKIVAEKLQPPASTRFTAGSMLGISINCPSTLSEPTFSVKNEHSYGHGVHLGRLDGFCEPDDHVHSMKRIVGSRILSHDVIGISKDNTGHRQASLADKHSSLLTNNPKLNSTLPATDSLATRRHIVPPDRLSELLDFPSTDNGFLSPDRSSYRLSTTTMTSDRNSKEFIALSPRPKNAYHASRT